MIPGWHCTFLAVQDKAGSFGRRVNTNEVDQKILFLYLPEGKKTCIEK